MCGVVKPQRVERGLMHCRLPGHDTSTCTAAGANDPNAGRVVSTCYPVGWPNGVRCRYGATSLLMSASEPLNS